MRTEVNHSTWMISRLQHKCLVLVLSILEMRDPKTDTHIVKRIIRNLSLEKLEFNLLKNYKMFEQIYGQEYSMECFEHIDIDPATIDDETFDKYYNKSKYYYQFIV